MLQDDMNQNTKVIVRVEYEYEGKRKVCLGETDEIKIERFKTGVVDNILMENDGKLYWIYREYLIFFQTLCAESVIFKGSRFNDLTQTKETLNNR